MNPSENLQEKLREKFKDYLISLGDFSIFNWIAIRKVKTLWKRRGLFVKHCESIGVSSLGIIVLSGAFMGGVLGYQLYESFAMFGAQALVGGSVGVALFREMAPVFAAVMVIGRSGAAMAAEIATMRVSEQVDALEVMAVDPMEYLVTPRIMAGFLMVPLLAMVFACVGSVASAGVACGVMGLDGSIYWQQFARWVDAEEMVHILLKSSVFGLCLSSIACFFGFYAQGGAGAVGRATRVTVVVSLLVVLMFDYILTSLLPYRTTMLKI